MPAFSYTAINEAGIKKKGILSANSEREARRLVKDLQLTPLKITESKDITKSLKVKNYKLAILSNGTPSLLDELVKSNNLENIFDDIFSIEQVGVYKPDSKVYDIPIKKYQIKKKEVVFLSANTWDVSGGGNYGYNSIWVKRNNNTFDNLDYVPKHQIKDLSKLLDII